MITPVAPVAETTGVQAGVMTEAQAGATTEVLVAEMIKEALAVEMIEEALAVAMTEVPVEGTPGTQVEEIAESPSQYDRMMNTILLRTSKRVV